MAIVKIRTLRIGEDIAFLVTGGQAHIGAVATAYRTAEGRLQTSCQAVPGHREGELAAELARMAAEDLRRTVTVLAGIHLERPSREDIAAVVEEARTGMARTLQRIKAADDGSKAGDGDGEDYHENRD